MSNNILRKLGHKESAILKRPSSNNFIQTFRLKTKIDFYNNLDLVNEAISKWKSMHQLLQAKILTVDNSEFFVRNDNSNPKNVNFYKFSAIIPDSNIIMDELSNLLIEREFQNLLTLNDDHLWRLTFVKFDLQNQSFCYEVLFLLNHTVSEARNSYSIFYQLIDLIDKFSIKNFNEHLKIYQLGPPTEELFLDFPQDYQSYMEAPKILRPSFTSLSRAKSISYVLNPVLDNPDLHLGYFESFSDSFSFKELLDISKASNNKMRRFVIDRVKSQKLFQSCRLQGAKLTSCLNLIIITSFIRLYKENNLKMNEIVFYIAISIRNCRNIYGLDKIDDEVMGYYIGGLMETYVNEYSSDEEIIKNFWPECKKLSINFHERLNKNNEKFAPKFKPLENNENELNMHFGMSNIGAVKDYRTKNGLIEIKDSFYFTNVTERIYNRFLFNFVTTVDDQICWGLVFNSFGIEHYIIDQVVVFIQNTLDKILA